MITHNPWLFEAPLVHETASYGNPYTQQEYYNSALGEQEWGVIGEFETGSRPVGPHPEVKTPLPASRQQPVRHHRNPAPGLQRPLPPLTTPALIRREPPGITLYVNIRLGGEDGATPMTGIYIPEGYRLQRQVDILLYLHGYKRVPPQPYKTWSIDWYWQIFPPGAFREGLEKSKKNVVLVAPTLGKISQAGWLKDPGGLDRYLDAVMAALRAYGPYRGQNPEVGKIILACHSGGGVPMRLIAGGGMSMAKSGWTSQRYTPLIRECWGFDCTYGRRDHIDSTDWGIWAQKSPDTHLYIYYIEDSPTAPEARKLRGKANVTVISSGTSNHHLVPITYWVPRLQQSFLKDK